MANKKSDIPERMIALMKQKKCFLAKSTIASELNITSGQVNRHCRLLRKQKIVGMYMKKYWGLIE